MALIPCSYCGEKVSDKATKCPNCGAPLEYDEFQRPHPVEQPQPEPAEPQPVPESSKNNHAGCWLVVFLVLAFAVIVYAILPKSHKEDTDESEYEVVELPDSVVWADQATRLSNIPNLTADGITLKFKGYIGDSDDAVFEMNGQTGTYSYYRQGENCITRTLSLESYNIYSGKCIINAYLEGMYIGQFDGYIDVYDDSTGKPEYKWFTYAGKFISKNNIELKFSLISRPKK